ncbi:MAG: membrane protein insertase YidC [Tannerella sp.]|jgi:YidC/Oxa1 family membrane protein insertase|nr:membrane protein insertase YidC [Tannerella sp.]
MSFDKNTIFAFLLIGLVLFVFTWLNRPDPAMVAQQRYQDSLIRVEQQMQQITETPAATQQAEIKAPESLSDSVKAEQLSPVHSIFVGATEGTEKLITLENDKIELKISNKGGKLTYARLKDYKTFDKQPLVLFDGDSESDFYLNFFSAANQPINTSDLYFTPVPGTDERSTVMRLQTGEGQHLDFIYTLTPDDYMLYFTIQGTGLNEILSPNTDHLDIQWIQKMRRTEQVRKFENQYTGLYYKLAVDDVENLSESKDDEERVPNRIKWIGYKNKYFSTVLIADDAFLANQLSSTQFPESETTYLKEFQAKTSVAFDLAGKETASFRYYIGPNQYQWLQTYDKGTSSDEQKLKLENLVPLGPKFFRPINRYFILPIFHFLGRFFTNYGLIIFLLTFIIKTVLFPFTYKSFMSSAKMRVLRPQVEAINAKYPKQEQAMERQKATMELYSQVGASPMSGCLPMLLPMLILIPLYYLFPTAIELRQESFLWAKDLSTFDPVISWKGNIPLISSFIGNHISLFCLLMTVANVLSTKINMSNSNTGQQQMPGMNMMMYLMPVMFFFLFNQNSSGLSYYFLISTLITLAQTWIFRLFLNEDKLLLQLEENKKKPKKKSGFMQRMEEMQRKQQEELRKQQKIRAKQQAGRRR